MPPAGGFRKSLLIR